MLADRCIQNIYRRLRQETDPSKKYPGVLASLLLLDKLSIEDIKASITELMAGGVDTVRNKQTKVHLFPSVPKGRLFSSFLFFFFADLHNPALDLVWTCQTSQPPGGAEGRGSGSTRWKPGRHAGDAETHPAGQRSFKGNTEVKK